MKITHSLLPIIFAEALNRNPGEQEQFLRERCEGQPELLQMSLRLLHHDRQAAEDHFLAVGGEMIDCLPSGLRIGPYRLLEILGQGGAGTVYRAIREDDYMHEVAIKVLSSTYSRWQTRERFLKEREILASLDHPNIGRILDGGSTPDHHLYYVMPMFKGHHIDAYCEINHLSFRERVSLIISVCDTLSYAHSKDVIHRDLKPGNLLVTEERKVMVVDFGLAQFPQGDRGITITGEVLGTPHYMAPESATGNGNNSTPATDVYSLGCVLYKLLTKEVPFQGNHPWKTMLSIVQDDPIPPHKVNPGTPPDLDSICLKCLRKEPKLRYLTASDLGEDLKRFLEGRPVLAKSPTWLDYSLSWGYRHRWMIGILLLCMGMGIVTGLIYNNSKTRHALELAKQSTDSLILIAIEMGKQPGMQLPQVELLSKTISTYSKLLQPLDREQTYLNYFRARHELVCAYDRLSLPKEASLEALQLLGDIEEYEKSHHSGELSIQLARSYSQACNVGTMPDDLSQKKILLSKAINVLTSLTEAKPGNHEAKGLLAEMHTSLARIESQLGANESAKWHFKEALAHFTYLYHEYPDDPQACIRLSSCQLHYSGFLSGNNSPEEGFKLLNASVELDKSLENKYPDHPDYRETTLNASCDLAHELERRGEWDKAQVVYLEVSTLCERLINLYPDIVGYQYQGANLQWLLGELTFAKGDTKASSEHFKKCVKMFEGAYRKHGIDGYRTSAYSQVLADCPFMELRDTKRAVELSRQCLEQLPNYKYLWANQGCCLFRNDELEKARQALEHSLQFDWQEDEAFLPRIFLAMTLAKMGRLEDAKKQYLATDEIAAKRPKEALTLRLRQEALHIINDSIKNP